jgi:hypothetical protein
MALSVFSTKEFGESGRRQELQEFRSSGVQWAKHCSKFGVSNRGTILGRPEISRDPFCN